MLERKVLPYKDSILDQWGEGVFVNHQSSFEAATAHVKKLLGKIVLLSNQIESCFDSFCYVFAGSKFRVYRGF